MFRDLFKETIWSLAGNKVRSGLTMLGIIIGIASVIALVAIGQGAQNSIEANIQAIGSNLIVISPGAQRSGSGLSGGRGSAQTLTFEDANAIAAGITDLQGVAPEVSRRYQVTAKSNNTNTQIIGTVPAYPAVRNISIDSGTFVTEQQVKTSAKVAVLGSTARDDLFGADVDPIGKSIRIQNIDFEVVGVMLSKGGSGFSNPDDSIYIPLTSAQHFLSGDEYVSSISVAASDQNSIASAQQQITDLLLARHKITDPAQADFSTINQSDIVATASSITGTFTVLLSSIAGISLLVGGIGIMNMMLTTVTERTREIGLRKAVGIRKIYINLQFLAEAIVLTFLGGAMGILLGWIASWVISNIINLEAEVSLSSILLAFGVSAAVGIIFGFYPARKAAAMSPIDALRYE
ncbi:MAG: ABC transporter permease [Candidatus Moranbacteria bacterium]|nr:ABC transporter permease [Candidatus Moranbacteria bacterium]